jgi:hypothetical protein
MDMQSGKWISMDTFMDNSMDNAKISFLDIKCGYLWRSLMDIEGYSWICMDIQDGYLIQYNKSDMFLWRPVYIHRYP